MGPPDIVVLLRWRDADVFAPDNVVGGVDSAVTVEVAAGQDRIADLERDGIRAVEDIQRVPVKDRWPVSARKRRNRDLIPTRSVLRGNIARPSAIAPSLSRFCAVAPSTPKSHTSSKRTHRFCYGVPVTSISNSFDDAPSSTVSFSPLVSPLPYLAGR